MIDGEDIAGIDRRTVRRRIGLVPQTPVIFAGSFRENIAPLVPGDDMLFALHADDAALDDLLERFHLGGAVAAHGGLDGRIDAHAALSQGQQQLLCAVRALARPSTKIVIFDEATASLDQTSAEFLQHTVYENFAGTVINIAHHMHFVQDADEVLCLHNGAIEDRGTPKELAAKPESLYAQQLAASRLETTEKAM